MTSLLLAANVSAELYKWIDQDGVVHYTDKRPAETGQQQELSGYLARIAKKNKPEAEEAQAPYSAFAITSPTQGERVWNAESTMDVVVQIDPALTDEHFLQVYLDGLAVTGKIKSNELTLQQLNKGSHNLQAEIVDEAGQTLSKTDKVTFQFRDPADLRKIAPNLAPPAQ
ncbi:MAG: DUF4124 domain-containing protein [Gammaproteobacteria bacterium]|nr:DUF4124 domain-containing protein [Gammaproteobacteria bacterium]